MVARLRSQELFVLNLLLVTLGAAFITDRFGLSLALGAFIAGMLIAETPYRHQVEEDIKPFRDVLLGLFFVTIGMLLNPRVIWAHPFIVLAFLSGPMLLKGVMVTVLRTGVRARRRESRCAPASGSRRLANSVSSC